MSVAASVVFAADHTNVLIPEANEVIWGLVSFVVLFAFMAKFVFPSMNKALKERTANIEGKLDSAEKERQQAEALLREYQQKLNEANAEAQRLIEQARANAERLEHELRVQAEDTARRTVERAQETIQAERDRALESLSKEVGTLAIDLATRVIGDSLDRDRQLKLVDQYISELSKPVGQNK